MASRYFQKYDAAANDSSKSFTVPAGEVWVITHIHAACTASADAGNRRLRVTVDDADGNEVMRIDAGATFAATQTQHAEFFPGAPDNTSEINDTLKVAMPVLILLPSWVLTVEDGAAVAAAADDLTVSFVYALRTP